PASVERAEFRSLVTERPNERERGGDLVDDESEPHPARKLQSLLGFAPDLIEWMARGEKTGSEIPASVGSKRRVALLVRHLNGTTRRIDALPHRPGPRDNEREDRIGLSSEALQPAAFGQVAGHLCESITCIVIAEAAAGR